MRRVESTVESYMWRVESDEESHSYGVIGQFLWLRVSDTDFNDFEWFFECVYLDNY